MGKWFDYGKVELHFETVEGEDRKILLYIKNYREEESNLLKRNTLVFGLIYNLWLHNRCSAGTGMVGRFFVFNTN
jgi:hypothetical protein